MTLFSYCVENKNEKLDCSLIEIICTFFIFYIQFTSFIELKSYIMFVILFSDYKYIILNLCEEFTEYILYC